MKPADFHAGPPMMFEELVGALGKAEAEWAAALVILWHRVHDRAEWEPLTRTQIADLVQTDPAARSWARNPFWYPDAFELIARGFITGWTTPDEPGSFTPAFFAAVQSAMQKRGARGGRA